jgi:hypothetical protein
MDLARRRSRSRSPRLGRETRGSEPRRLSLFRQQRRLERQDLQDHPSRVGDTKPSAVDLWKGPSAAGARWPLQLESIAANERGIPVALDGLRLNDLAASMPCLAEREEISVRTCPVSSTNSRRAAYSGARLRQPTLSECSRHRHPCFAKMVLPDDQAGLRDRRHLLETGGAQRFAISAKPSGTLCRLPLRSRRRFLRGRLLRRFLAVDRH